MNPEQTVELLIACSDAAFLKKYGKEIAQETHTLLKEGRGAKEKLLEREFFIALGG